MKVRQLANKNQFVMEDGEQIIFQSYNSVIAIYGKEKDVLVLGCDWDYSKTTLKHLYIFIDEELPYFMPLVKQLQETKNANNRRQTLQKLIDSGVIQYNKELQ